MLMLLLDIILLLCVWVCKCEGRKEERDFHKLNKTEENSVWVIEIKVISVGFSFAVEGFPHYR